MLGSVRSSMSGARSVPGATGRSEAWSSNRWPPAVSRPWSSSSIARSSGQRIYSLEGSGRSDQIKTRAQNQKVLNLPCLQDQRDPLHGEQILERQPLHQLERYAEQHL